MKKQKGFSLIELLIVVAIILIIARAIAIPNLLKSKMAANESSGVGAVRTLNTGESRTTRLRARHVGYSRDVGRTSIPVQLAPEARASSIAVLAGGAKSGYVFAVNPRLRVRDALERHLHRDGYSGQRFRARPVSAVSIRTRRA